jgi:hypothetical protein
MTDSDITIGKLLVIEYERLKDEQKTRIGFRDSLVYATLASMAAVITATLSARSQLACLLLLPPVCVLLGWTYLMNDEKISAAGHYIRTEITPRLADLVPGEPLIFGWESFHRGDSRRRLRKVAQLTIDLSMFCVAPATALALFWVSAPQPAALIVVSVAEALVVIGLAIHICLYADLWPYRSAAHETPSP